MQSDNKIEDSVKEGIDNIGPNEELINLPTGKPHISFSEMKTWTECTYRHKLQFVDKVGEFKPGVHMDFGTAIHSACEHFLRTKVIDEKVFLTKFHELWKEHTPSAPDVYTVSAFKNFVLEARAMLPEIPGWFDTTFPGWEFVDAEHQLYEKIKGHPHAFKGFIDCVIRVPGPRNKMLTWVLDFKTTSWGWNMQKKSDETVRAQLVLYKNYWSSKTNTNPKDVRCGFVLLKRAAKPGAHCELITASVGDVTTGRSLKVINNMITSVKKGIAFKNRASCTYCDYRDTPHCT